MQINDLKMWVNKYIDDCTDEDLNDRDFIASVVDRAIFHFAINSICNPGDNKDAMPIRYVLEKMQEKGWRIGAENSGHVILLDKTTTGDGIVAGLQVLAAMARNHMSLHDLCSGMKMFPQILVNVSK